LTSILATRKISLVQKGSGNKGVRKGLGFSVKPVTYINKSHNKNFPKWGKIGGFQVFFSDFRGKSLFLGQKWGLVCLYGESGQEGKE
jgi:regulatory protein YycH of two-component signal transduction system YycFG